MNKKPLLRRSAERFTSTLKHRLRQAGVRRSRAAAVRMYCERNLLARIGTTTLPPQARILCYHSVGTPQWGVNDVTPERFRRQIDLALQLGHRFVAADHIARTGGQPGDLAITFDDGLASVLANAAPVLTEYAIPWSLFVVSDWADGRHAFGDGVLLDWDGVLAAAAAGASIGSHSGSHPDFGVLAEDQAAYELQESRRAIERHTGLRPTTFAIPFGQSMNWSTVAGQLARQAGYELVFAQSDQRRPPGTVPRTFITSFDDDRVFRAALRGSFARWEEWM